MRRFFFIAFAVLAFAPGQVKAIPDLQLYIEGSTYNTTTETWTTSVNPNDTIRLWVISQFDPSKNSSNGGIDNLTIFVNTGDSSNLSLAAARIGGTGSYGGFSDSYNGTLWTVGSPSSGTGTPPGIERHGIYNDSTPYLGFGISYAGAKAVSIADFQTSFPSPEPNKPGYIIAYDVTYTGAAGTTLHFDISGVTGYKKGEPTYKNAPYSHDAEATYTGPVVPEPSTLAIAGLGALGFVGYGIRRRRSK